MASKKLEEIKDAVGADTISKKNGIITVRKSFFYTHGYTAEQFADRVKQHFPNAQIVSLDEVWKDFRGGATVANQSHWRVDFRLD